MKRWRIEAQTTAGFDDDPARPAWNAHGVPLCSRGCVHHDGKRCRATGNDVGTVCEPVVAAMARQLSGRRA